MNAPTGKLAAAPKPQKAAKAAAPATAPATRHDGWTATRQQDFLDLLSQGHTVEAACGFVGLSVASAYALRRRPAGAAFALGWRAACLLARDRLADILMSRAIDGQVDTYTRADGSEVTRHRFDNRLATAMLTRLDRLAEAAPALPGTIAAEDAEAARLAAADFAGTLDLVEAAGEDFEEDAETDATEAVAEFVAEAASSRNPQLPQLRTCRKGREWIAREGLEGQVDEEIVWWDEDDEQWLTIFPPPPHFDGREYGSYGEPTYARTIMLDEYPGLGLGSELEKDGEPEEEDEDA